MDETGSYFLAIKYGKTSLELAKGGFSFGVFLVSLIAGVILLSKLNDWAIDVTAPNRAIIFEVWDDQAALDAHFTHPYMDTMVAALSEANIRGGITRYSTEIYDVSAKRDMGFVLATE